jgi:hypothetical protein
LRWGEPLGEDLCVESGEGSGGGGRDGDGGDAGGVGGLDVPAAHPEEEDHEAPEVIADVDAAVAVELEEAAEEGEIEEGGVFALGGVESIGKEGEERAAEPFVSGNVEADFAAFEDGFGEFGAHEFLEDEFLAAVVDFEAGGEVGGELDDAVIEEDGADLDGVGHAHAVGFDEDVVGEEVLLVEFEEGGESVAGERVAKRGEDVVEGGGQGKAEEGGFFRVGEGAVPVGVGAGGGHERPFKEAL